MLSCIFLVLFLLVVESGNKIVKRCKYVFFRNYALAYCRMRHVNFGGDDIKFIGHVKLSISPMAKVEIGDKFICASGIDNGIDNNYIFSKIRVDSNASLKIGFKAV